MGPRRMTTQVVVCLIPVWAWLQLNNQVVQLGIVTKELQCRKCVYKDIKAEKRNL